MFRGRDTFLLFFLLLTYPELHVGAGAETQPATCTNTNSKSEEDIQQEDARDKTSNQNNDVTVCGLWMAESSLYGNRFGLFTGVEIAEGNNILEDRDVLIPIFDANQNEWSPWHEIAQEGAPTQQHAQADLFLQNYFQIRTFVPGLASSMLCSDEVATVATKKEDDDDDDSLRNVSYDSQGVHRSKDPTAGSFSYRESMPFVATTNLTAGRELFANCNDSGDMNRNPFFGFSDYIKQHMKKPIPMLQEEGICVDNISVRPSTIPKIGKGAFAKRRVRKGGTIISSPVVALDRSQMEIVRQRESEMERVEYSEEVVHQNLLLNYCYGHPNSTVLLLPYAPGVNYINHNHQEPNAIVDWSQSRAMQNDLLEMTAHEVLSEPFILIFDYLALRDIEPGEEIFLDYGQAWQAAWEKHVREWKAPLNSETYVSAVDYYRSADPDSAIRTVIEQRANPYPSNIITTCFYKEDIDDDDDDDDDDEEEESLFIVWKEDEHNDCLRPCTIQQRYSEDDEIFYNVQVHEMTNHMAPDECDLSKETLWVTRVPASAIQLADKEYTSDQLMQSSFRHEIGVRMNTPPDHWKDMYPDSWMMADAEPGDFIQEPLIPGQIEQIRWKDDGKVVAQNAHVMGLSPRVREVLLEYCDRMGITERFRDLTYRGNALQPGVDEQIVLNELNWLVQRPASHWKSNMHWISPRDAEAQVDYLKALSAAGFDEVLQQVGQKFGMDGLAAYHVTFIAVSHCNRGFLHYDVRATGNSVFNVIIPLILANETGPELDLKQDGSRDRNDVGRLRYQYDVASMMGDDAYHGTSAVDYRMSKEMRMAATVYIADINEKNVDAILQDYTQSYPPKGRPDILLQMAGTHWKKDDPSIMLPKPTHDRVAAKA